MEISFSTEGVGHLQIRSYRLAMEDCPNQLNYTDSEMDTVASKTSSLVSRSRPMIRCPNFLFEAYRYTLFYPSSNISRPFRSQ